MEIVLRMYYSFLVCHKLFVHTYCKNFFVIGVLISMVVFIVSAFQLIMLRSEKNYILTFAFSCGSVISGLALTNIIRFANKLSSSSETLIQVLNGKVNSKHNELVIKSYIMLKIPYSAFFAIERDTMLSIGGFSMDILISWILEYIAMQ